MTPADERAAAAVKVKKGAPGHAGVHGGRYGRFKGAYLDRRGRWAGDTGRGGKALREVEALLGSGRRPVATLPLGVRRAMLVLDNGTAVAVRLGEDSEFDAMRVDSKLVKMLGASRVVAAAASPTVLAVAQEDGRLVVVRLPAAGLDEAKLKKSAVVGSCETSMPVTAMALNGRRDMVLAVGNRAAVSRSGRGASRALILYALDADGTPEALCDVACQGADVHAAFSTRKPGRIVAVEALPKAADGIVIARYQYTDGALVRKSAHRYVPPEGAGALTACAWNRTESRVVLGFRDGTLALVSPKGKPLAVRRLDGRHEPTSIAWHADGAFLIAAFDGGNVAFLDAGLAPLAVQTEFGPGEARDGIHIGTSGRMLASCWMHARDELAAADRRSSGSGADNVDLARRHENVLLVVERGPLIAVRVVLGPGGRRGRPVDFVRHRLAGGRLDDALALVRAIDEDDEETYHEAASTIARVLLTRVVAPTAKRVGEILDDLAAARFLDARRKPPSPFHRTWIETYRAFFLILVRLELFEQAYALADRLDEDDLFMDLATWARYAGDDAVAAIALRRAGQDAPGTHAVPVAEAIVRASQMALPAWPCPVEDVPRSQAVALGLDLEARGLELDARRIYHFHGLGAELARLDEYVDATAPSTDAVVGHVAMTPTHLVRGAAGAGATPVPLPIKHQPSVSDAGASTVSPRVSTDESDEDAGTAEASESV